MISLNQKEITDWLRRTKMPISEIAQRAGVNRRTLEYLRSSRPYPLGVTMKTVEGLLPIYLEDASKGSE